MSRRMAMVAALLMPAAPACAADGLLFQAEAQTLTGACHGDPVRIEGNHNTVTVSGVCASLLLKGFANTVSLGIAPGGAIRVEGAANRVRYAAHGAPPAVQVAGPPDNVVTPEGGPAPAPATSPPSSPAQPSPPASPPKPAAAPAAATLSLDGEDQEHRLSCAGRDVVITGRRSAYSLTGGCKSLAVRGDLLTVSAVLQPGAKVEVAGRGSVVSWSLAGRGKPPSAVAHGAGSRVQRLAEDG